MNSTLRTVVTDWRVAIATWLLPLALTWVATATTGLLVVGSFLGTGLLFAGIILILVSAIYHLIKKDWSKMILTRNGFSSTKAIGASLMPPDSNYGLIQKATNRSVNSQKKSIRSKVGNDRLICSFVACPAPDDTLYTRS